MISFDGMPGAIEQLTAKLSAIESTLAAVLKRQEARNYPPYSTRTQTAERLHISLTTLHTWTLAGKIPAYRVGGKVLYRPEEVDAALQAVNVGHKKRR